MAANNSNKESYHIQDDAYSVLGVLIFKLLDGEIVSEDHINSSFRAIIEHISNKVYLASRQKNYSSAVFYSNEVAEITKISDSLNDVTRFLQSSMYDSDVQDSVDIFLSHEMREENLGLGQNLDFSIEREVDESFYATLCKEYNEQYAENVYKMIKTISDITITLEYAKHTIQNISAANKLAEKKMIAESFCASMDKMSLLNAISKDGYESPCVE